MVTKQVKSRQRISNFNMDEMEFVEKEEEIEEIVVDPVSGENKIQKKKVLRRIAVPKNTEEQEFISNKEIEINVKKNQILKPNQKQK